MTIDEVKAKAHAYIDGQLLMNPNWLDTITDSWIYDAENWFDEYLRFEKKMSIWEDWEEGIYTSEAQEYHNIFWNEALEYKDKKEIEINGVRDGIEMLRNCMYEVQGLQKQLEKAYEYLKPHFNDGTFIGNSEVPLKLFQMPATCLKEAENAIKVLGNKLVDIANEELEEKK